MSKLLQRFFPVCHTINISTPFISKFDLLIRWLSHGLICRCVYIRTEVIIVLCDIEYLLKAFIIFILSNTCWGSNPRPFYWQADGSFTKPNFRFDMKKTNFTGLIRSKKWRPTILEQEQKTRQSIDDVLPKIEGKYKIYRS